MIEIMDAPWVTKKRVALAALVVFIVTVAVLVTKPTHAEISLEKLGIPLPFGGSIDSSHLTGMVSYYGKRNGIDLYEVTFKNGEKSEPFMPDRIYLVHIPNDPTITNAPLDNIMSSLATASHSVNFYGYKYSDAVATMERRDQFALRFIDRFPGQFFASKAARDDDQNHGNMLQAFENETGAKFLKTDSSVGAPRIDNAGSLFVFVVNEVGGASFSPSDRGTCGNQVVEGAEECDDGNTNNADMCKNDCSEGIPVPFGSGSSMSGAKLAVTQQPMVATDTAGMTNTGMNFLTFQASASTENVSMTKLLFSAATGSISSVKNMTLWKDTDNDNVVDTLVKNLTVSSPGLLAFSGSELIAKHQTITYEVHGDIAIAPAIFRLRLATVEAHYVGGQRVDYGVPLSGIRTNGVCSVPVCQIVVTTMPTTLWTFLPVDPIRLVVQMNSAFATGTLLRGHTGSLLQARITSKGENLEVRKISFKAMTGSVQDMQFSLWADTDGTGTFTQQSATITRDSVARTVTFENVGGIFPVTPSRNVPLQLRAVSNVASGFFKVAFNISASDYVDAWTQDDAASSPHLLGIKTNSFCQGVVCEVHVLERPTTLFRLQEPAYTCGNAVREGPEECDTGASNGQACTPPQGGTCSYCSSSCENVTLHGSAPDVGSLYVTNSTTPIRMHQLLGGTLGDEILRVRLHAEGEAIDVTNIALTATGADAASAASTIDRLELYKVGDTTPFSFATTAACEQRNVPANSFCASLTSQELVVASGANMNVLVRPRMNTDVNGAVSGKKIGIFVDHAWTGTSPVVEARGVSSHANLARSDQDTVEEGEVFLGVNAAGPDQKVMGKEHVVTLSKLLSITNGDTNTDGTAISQGTNIAIGKFTMTTHPNMNSQGGLNRWTLTDIIFTVDAENVRFDDNGFKIYNSQDNTQTSPCIVLDSSSSWSSFYVACWNIRLTSVETEIDPDSSETFVLAATIEAPQISLTAPSSLQVFLRNFSDATQVGMAHGLSHIHWLDNDATVPASEFWWVEDHATEIASTHYGITNTSPVCGNGAIEGSETCDDGDTDSGDGCSSLCAIEPHFRCIGTPSVCQSYNAFVLALADTNHNGVVSDTEALVLTLDLVDAPDQPYNSVSRFDIDNDGDVDTTDVTLILAELDVLAPS